MLRNADRASDKAAAASALPTSRNRDQESCGCNEVASGISKGQRGIERIVVRTCRACQPTVEVYAFGLLIRAVPKRGFLQSPRQIPEASISRLRKPIAQAGACAIGLRKQKLRRGGVLTPSLSRLHVFLVRSLP